MRRGWVCSPPSLQRVSPQRAVRGPAGQTWRHTPHGFPLRKPLAQVGKRPKWISPSFQDRKCSPEIICHFLLQRLSARGWSHFCRNGTADFLPSTPAHTKPAPFSTPETYQKTRAQGPSLWRLSHWVALTSCFSAQRANRVHLPAAPQALF